MKHLGDITKLKGSEVPLTEIVVGGSPCQDLSVAGKRAGLAGARSGLFMEQIRLIKEMRENDRKNGRTDEHIRPRYMVWENVPGAFSSNKGEDFRAVLEETAKVAEGDACIPRLEKWPHAGCIMGDGWSIAWRVHDAQFWGVPQRRKRIALVADFGGATAPEILFERKGMSGDTSESGEARKGTAEDVERGVGEAIGFTNRGFESGKVTETLRSEPHGAYPMVAYDEGGVACGKEGKVTILNPSDSQGNQVADSDGIYPTLRGCGGAGYQQGYLFERKNSTTVFGISSYDSNAMKSSNPHSGIYEADTSRTLDLNGGSPACNQGGMAVVQAVGVDTYNQSIDEEVAQPLRAADGGDSTPKVCYRKTSHAKSKEDGQGWQETEVNDTLNIFDNGESRTPTVIVEVAQPLRCAEGGDSAPKVVAFTQNQRNEVRDLGEKAGALAAERGVHQQTYVLEGNGSRPSHKGDGYSESETMYTLNSTEHHAVCAEPIPINTMVATRTTDENRTTFGIGSSGDPQFTLSSAHSHAVAVENHPADSRVKVSDDGMVQTLSSRMGTGGGNVPMIMEEPYNATTGSFMRAGNSGVAETLAARDYKDPQIVCNSVVRRLTPLECERLQGYPDGWTDIGEWYDSKGKKHKDADSPRYKALGNSIALPFWEWMAERMVRLIKNDEPTMASLFSGIGGFELVFSRAGCEPVWCSEIEEFPIAVTKYHFPDNE